MLFQQLCPRNLALPHLFSSVSTTFLNKLVVLRTFRGQGSLIVIATTVPTIFSSVDISDPLQSKGFCLSTFMPTEATSGSTASFFVRIKAQNLNSLTFPGRHNGRTTSNSFLGTQLTIATSVGPKPIWRPMFTSCANLRKTTQRKRPILCALPSASATTACATQTCSMFLCSQNSWRRPTQGKERRRLLKLESTSHWCRVVSRRRS
mmetsp:Transcript_26958/g.55159  ORF Transcript_26958/g.55159 Transcript_26958/m.55159 type:complete len:206 (-) Transcript_26958:1618-2235(-)